MVDHRHRKLVGCSLAVAAAAACAGAAEPAGSSEPASSVPPTAAAREFGVPDRADPPDEGTVTVRFVTYGDIDPDDRVPFGAIPDVRIAIIKEDETIGEDYFTKEKEIRNNLKLWWETVGGHDLVIKERIPPGVRVQSKPEQLAAAPARFVTTGPDGTLEMPIAYNLNESNYHSICTISPVIDSLIAGCNYQNMSPWRYIISGGTMTIYVYFNHGHAIVEDSFTGGDRFQRFSDGIKASKEPAYLWVRAGGVSDLPDIPPWPVGDALVVVVNGAHVNDWWEAISDDDTNKLDILLGYPDVGSEVLERDWTQSVTTGPDGLGMIALPPDDYLLCEATNGRIVAGCLYENLVGSRHYIFGITFTEGGPGHISMWEPSEEEVERFTEMYLDETSDG